MTFFPLKQKVQRSISSNGRAVVRYSWKYLWCLFGNFFGKINCFNGFNTIRSPTKNSIFSKDVHTHKNIEMKITLKKFWHWLLPMKMAKQKKTHIGYATCGSRWTHQSVVRSIRRIKCNRNRNKLASDPFEIWSSK